jgi:hypothetical protein
MLLFVRTFERYPQSQATGKPALKLSKNGKVIADVAAAICQNLHGCDVQRQPKTRHEILIPLRPAVQHIIVDEYFAACE